MHAPTAPPALQPIAPALQDLTRHLSVTQLEALGKVPHYNPMRDGKRAFRQSVLHDAPAPIRPMREQSLGRVVGLVVHHALQVGMAHTSKNLDKHIKAYAWNEGISDTTALAEIARAAKDLLKRSANNLPNSLHDADEILREVPFIYQTEQRILHGVVDVVYRYQEQWYVLDYKTAKPRSKAIDHAKQYYMQVGAYAQALEARLGQTPRVQLYYLYPGILVTVQESAWREALATLPFSIAAALD